MLFMDQPLACRLERVEGTVGASFTDVRRRLMPHVGAGWRDFDGTYAIFDGPGSPMTQSFGLGLSGAITAQSLVAIETFFESRGADTTHEVTSLAGLETVALLVDRGYRPVELGTVLVQLLDPDIAVPASPLRVRPALTADREAWIRTSVAGWSDDAAPAQAIHELAEAAFENPTMSSFLVEHEGVPIATAALGIHEGVALLAGASTIRVGRGRGAQNLLLAVRLAAARQHGCDLAMMVTAPGSTSQRNAERRGFRIAYTRTKWQLASRVDRT